MKLSLRGEYALRAMLVLGLNYEQPVVRIQTISDQQNIPKRFLEQILNDLKSGGFVQSKRGMAGGYRLARRPEQITVAAIVRHVEGALAPVSCVSERFYEKCSCPDESRCAIRSVMKEVREAIVGIVERVTVAETLHTGDETPGGTDECPGFCDLRVRWQAANPCGSADVLAVPIHRQFQPGVDSMGGGEAEQALRLADVCQRMPHVPGTKVTVHGLLLGQRRVP